MRITAQHVGSAVFVLVMALSARGQAFQGSLGKMQDQPPASVAPEASQSDSSTAPVTYAVEQLRGFTAADAKFDLRDLMNLLRDRGHEGWVLAAYPDPKTGHPLIGAGFTLDLPAREHPQRDPLNPHPFIEPSSAELWQAAGLAPGRLQTILHQYDNQMAAWGKNRFRKRIKTLAPQITDEEATRLLRVSAIQAIYNAKGYCREFDQWSAPQQMALSQMVYQMGFNLQNFSQFLEVANSGSTTNDANTAPSSSAPIAHDPAYWKTVQQSLVESQWARLYHSRAVSVIAMFDPQYADEPGTAMRRLSPLLPAPAVRRHGRRSEARPQLVSDTRRFGKRRAGGTAGKTKSHPQRRRKT